MISILIVDDNANKIKIVKDSICFISSIDQEVFTIATDRNTAKSQLMNKQFDLMILDISIPERFGDIPDDNGGADFLKEINMDPDIIAPFHIIGLTAYPKLKESHNDVFSQHLWHLITYEEQYDNWKDILCNHIRYLIKSKEELRNPSNLVYDYDIAIITVLSLELKFVKELPGHWVEEKFDNDDNFYYVGYFLKKDKKIRIVVTSSNNNMGMSATATTSMKIINRYRPKYITMVGICAGVEGKGNIGDPIIADRVWDYGSGKHVIEKTSTGDVEVFKPYINQLPLNTSLNSAFTKAIEEGHFTSEIQRKWSINYPTPLTAKLGPFASGSSVIANENIVYSIKQQHEKLVGFDMEAYAVFYTALNCPSPKPTPFTIKSISDYGNINKNTSNKESDQAYAAYTSANYLYHFAIQYLKFTE